MFKISTHALIVFSMLLLVACGSQAPAPDSRVEGGNDGANGHTQSGKTYGIVSCRSGAKLESLPDGKIQLHAERKCNPILAQSAADGIDLAKTWIQSECSEVHAEWFDPRLKRVVDCKVMSNDRIDLNSQSSEIASKKPSHCDAEAIEVQPLLIACKPL